VTAVRNKGPEHATMFWNILEQLGDSGGSFNITTTDNHIEGRTFGPGNEWIVKDIGGVFPAMELERAITIIGLAFKMPYVPADSARTEFDVLHFTMFDNAFSFSTSMMKEGAFNLFFSSRMYTNLFIFVLVVDYKCDIAAVEATTAGQSSTPKCAVRKGLFASASPASSNNISSSTGIRKPSLRPPETGVFFLFFLEHIMAFQYLTIVLVQFLSMMVESVN